MTEELNRLKVEPASDKELQKVRNEVSASFVRGLDSNFGLARQLAYYELLTGDWRYVVNHSKKVESI